MHAAPTADLGESLELTDENVEMVLDEIRPYLMAGAAPLDILLHPYSSLQPSYRLPLSETNRLLWIKLHLSPPRLWGFHPASLMQLSWQNPAPFRGFLK